MQMKRFEPAEKIYNNEVQRLLSNARKEEITKIYIDFAELLSKKPGKNELDDNSAELRQSIRNL